ncbi:hypothetical protein BJ741DRAFT_90570 [Chytriomyces cf. hyalinus JEL632]|nr:hypothetical protein BJ741DRAFT_90570 [Chytriomyces cf. hyalinus JEL632]
MKGPRRRNRSDPEKPSEILTLSCAAHSNTHNTQDHQPLSSLAPLSPSASEPVDNSTSNPFPPTHEDINDDDEALSNFSSKLVLDFTDPPMTPPSEPPPLEPLDSTSQKRVSSLQQCSSLKIIRKNHIFAFRVTENGCSRLDDKKALKRDCESDAKFHRITQDFASCLKLNKPPHDAAETKKTKSRSILLPYSRSRSKSWGKKAIKVALLPFDSINKETAIPTRTASQKSIPTICGSLKLPSELWIAIFRYIVPKTMCRILRTCSTLSVLGFDPMYWNSACINSGLDSRLIELDAQSLGIIVDAFSFSSPNTILELHNEPNPRSTYQTPKTEELEISSLSIKGPYKDAPSKAGRKRRHEYSSTEINPFERDISSRQRRKIDLEKLQASTLLSTPLKWWTLVGMNVFYPRLESKSIHIDKPTNPPQTSKYLSWLRVYASQFKVRKSFLQNPYKFRRLSSAHNHGITSLVVSNSKTDADPSTSKRIVTAAWDGSIKVWKLLERDPISIQQDSAAENVLWDTADNEHAQLDAVSGLSNIPSQHPGTNAAEDSMWETGNENDGLGMGELLNQVVVERAAIIPSNVGTMFESETEGEHWSGGGRYELLLERTIETQFDQIECLSVHGNLLVSGGRGLFPLAIHDLTSGTPIKYLQPRRTTTREDSIHVSSIDMDASLIISAQKQTIHVWSIKTGTLLASISRIHPDANIASIQLFKSCANSWYIFEGCAFGSISVWKFKWDGVTQLSDESARTVTVQPITTPDNNNHEPSNTSSPEFQFTLQGPLSHMGTIETTAGMNCMNAHHSSGKTCTFTILCGFKDGNIRSYKAQISDHKEPTNLLIHATGSLCSLGDWITNVDRDSQYGNVVVAGAWDGRIRVWDQRTCALRRSLVSDTQSAVLCLKMIGQDVLVAGSYNGSLVVYDFSGAKQG